ncbi:MAG TPA: DUF1134 domain-containing protein [Nevskiaceae bacterium]|nr:DUF1134 domain-containing protein [Nevskiaceae bacterium]
MTSPPPLRVRVLRRRALVDLVRALLGSVLLLATVLVLLAGTARAEEAAPPAEVSEQTYTADEVLEAARGFFGDTTEGLAKAIEKIFAEQGRPNAYIIGEEGSGAFGVGLRYGEGQLHYKGGGGMPVYWQGPSIGWDFGANASKVFTLVYNLRATHQLMQRFPGAEGSFYLIGGVGVNYQKSGTIVLAPIRTGVGLRAGASIGYLHYTPTRSWLPL